MVEGPHGIAPVRRQPLAATATQCCLDKNGRRHGFGQQPDEDGCEWMGQCRSNSTKAITAGDGYMEFTSTGQTTESRIAGLSRGDTDQGYQDVDFGIDLAGNGLVYIYEAGVPRGTFGSYAAGDIFRVAIEGGVVKYRKNGVLLYMSTLVPSYPLLVDCALQTYSGTLNNVMIYGSLQLSDSYTPPPMDFSSRPP